MSDAIVAGTPQGSSPLDLAPEIAELVAHGDDNLVLSQRLSEWISNAPELEIDIALGNTALDHLGVARALYTYAAEIEAEGRTEDDFAMRRSERDFRNVLLVEQPNGDFANTIVRQLFFDVYSQITWSELAAGDDERLAGIAGRAVKEADYHFEFSSSWLVRLGDGTEESHRRSQDAVDRLWRYTSEVSSEAWMSRVGKVFEEAGLMAPDDAYQRVGGRDGYHTEHLGVLLAEMQWMDRAYPGMEW